jgi:hypothetical protein
VSFKAKASNDGNDDDSETSTDDDVALMVKKFMKKKGYQGGSSKSGKSYSKNPFTKKKCFECGKMRHISTNCKNKDEDHSSNKKFEGKKNCSRSTSRRKMARHVMSSGIRMQVKILTPMMMREMRNPQRRVLLALLSRRLHLYSTLLIV